MSVVYEIRHELDYRYSLPIHFEAHTFFLRPRSDGTQKVLDYSLSINPAPVLIAENPDPFGNYPARVWFQGLSPGLRVIAISHVKIDRSNPFDYLMEDDCVRLPVSYPPAFEAGLAVYLKSDKDPEIREFSDQIAKISGPSTGDFLLTLCREICMRFKKVKREHGGPWTPSQTMAEKKGACRDLTLLFMAACRAQGIAARFTSGYFDRGLNGSGKFELHAWAEVYLQGAGWRGYDPMWGIAVAEQHIAVAAAPENYSLSPVQGSFRGYGHQTRFHASVMLTKKEETFKSCGLTA